MKLIAIAILGGFIGSVVAHVWGISGVITFAIGMIWAFLIVILP